MRCDVHGVHLKSEHSEQATLFTELVMLRCASEIEFFFSSLASILKGLVVTSKDPERHQPKQLYSCVYTKSLGGGWEGYIIVEGS
mgnify:CR=1 FL=1